MIFIRIYCIECGTFSQESSMLYCYTAWKHSHLWFTHYHSGYNNPANPPNPMNYHSCFFLKNNIPATSCMSSFMDSDLEIVSVMCWFPRCVTIQMISIWLVERRQARDFVSHPEMEIVASDWLREIGFGDMDTINLDSWGGNSTCLALSKNNGIRRGGGGVEFMSKVRSKGLWL